jgi:hypothetical protein
LPALAVSLTSDHDNCYTIPVPEIPTSDPNPPPLQAVSISRRKPFPFLAAKLSLWSPFLGLLIFGSTGAVLNEQDENILLLGTLSIAICSILWISGFCFGGFALYATKKVGRKGIFVKATIGMILDAVLLGIAASVLVAELQIWQNAPEVHRNIRAEAAMNEAEQSFRKMLSDKNRDFQNALAALKNPLILNPAEIKSEEDLQKGITAIKKFVAAAGDLINLLTNAFSLYEGELAGGIFRT